MVHENVQNEFEDNGIFAEENFPETKEENQENDEVNSAKTNINGDEVPGNLSGLEKSFLKS